MPIVRARYALALVVAVATACTRDDGPREEVRIGYFPNVTHAPALIAAARSRTGDGVYERRLGRKVAWYPFKAGPSAAEALLAGSLDATFIGPNPAINAFLRAKGRGVRVIAGATRGGAALVGRRGGPTDAAGFRGLKVGTPQFGNTQDVSARAWFMDAGLNVTQSGGDVTILPTENASLLALFKKGEIDGAWTVEPWVSRLELEGDGVVVHSEDDALTTVLVCSARFLEERPADAKALVEAHREILAWMAERRDDARETTRLELERETRGPVPSALMERCWPRLRFGAEIELAPFAEFAERARRCGFLPGPAQLEGLVRTP
ncbi:MAG TPA: ABC transporter substrate-binding protein [Planctomycetota bacterium]|nr:ABC transporter substrate-binding protein [Planctomycetota bacterium]